MIDIDSNAEKIVDELKKAENEIDFTLDVNYNYKSLPICIVDCVYSLSANYESTVEPLIQKFADLCMSGNKEAEGYRITNFLSCVDGLEGEGKSLNLVEFQRLHSIKTDLSHYDRNRKFVVFADKLGSFRPNGRKKNRVLRSELCYKLAKMLNSIYGIDTLDDFERVRKESPVSLYLAIQSMDGIGLAGANYLFMLTGDTSLCKPDKHVFDFVNEDCGVKANFEEIQLLLTDATKILNRDEYPDLTVRQLDYVIWKWKSSSHHK